MRPAFALASALALLLAVACAGGDGDGPGDDDADGGAPTATLVVTDDENSHAEVTVELARTPAQRSRGLMFREELPQQRGMLFVFANNTTTAFWMKDTLIPLSIAFISADGAILEIQDMEPLSTELHQPTTAYRYALEVNQGWFQRNGFGPGDRVEIPEGIQTPEAGE